MKGQGINLDWTIGLGLFLVTILSGVLMVVSTNLGPDTGTERQEALLIQDSLEDETYITGRQAPLIVTTPVNVSSIPVDREYIFAEDAYAGSGSMDIPADINISGERVITVVDGKNTTHDLNYFFSEQDNLSYSEDNDIDTGDWMNNTDISVEPGSNSLQSLEVNGKEVLNPDADIDGSDTVEEHEIHASTLDNDLKLYNGSKELILEDPGTVTFDLKNFTELYWYNGNETKDTMELDSNGESKETPAFTLASTLSSDHGITFLGEDLNATVSRPDDSTVRAETTSSRLRIYLHNSDYETGWKRARFFDEGKTVIGAEEELEGASKGKINGLENSADRGFENRLDIENPGYNITFGSLERGRVIPLEDVVVSDLPSVMLGRYGNYSIIENRVAVWR